MRSNAKDWIPFVVVGAALAASNAILSCSHEDQQRADQTARDICSLIVPPAGADAGALDLLIKLTNDLGELKRAAERANLDNRQAPASSRDAGAKVGDR